MTLVSHSPFFAAFKRSLHTAQDLPLDIQRPKLAFNSRQLVLKPCAWLAPAVGLALCAAAMPAAFQWPALDLIVAAVAQGDPIVFYRDPMGEALFARAPKKDSMGMDYLPVTRSQISPLLGKLPPTAAPAFGVAHTPR